MAARGRRPGAPEEPSPAGVLYVVATPIGNLSDVTLRALEVLGRVDRIAAEDTRRARQLLDRHGIRAAVLEPYHAHNEARMAGRLAGRLRRGESLALMTDAGTPGVADPAYRLTRAALEVGATVVPIPGASAVLAALAASGLPTDRFVFEGFPPRRPGPRRRMLARLAYLPHTLVFFEVPSRLRGLLVDVEAVLGDREMAVGRELTKLHEEVWRGKVGAYLATSSQAAVARLKGEVTLVVAGQSRAAARQAARDAAREAAGSPEA
jgi:16S rRNA (cytidine1402-2'-O)-methyltransferase